MSAPAASPLKGLLRTERILSLVPLVAPSLLWVPLALVSVILYVLEPTRDMAVAAAGSAVLTFALVVLLGTPFLALLLRLRRRGMDISYLLRLQKGAGGDLVRGSLALPFVRPRLFTRIGGADVEVVLSPPLPRTDRPFMLDPERAMAKRVLDFAERAMETDLSRLALGRCPQLEVRAAVDYGVHLRITTSPRTPQWGGAMKEVPVDPSWSGIARAFSDEPSAAAELLRRPEARSALGAAVTFNAPWSTQLFLRPAHKGGGAGLYMLSVVGPDTSCDDLVSALRGLVVMERRA